VLSGALDARRCARGLAALESGLRDHLAPLTAAIPPQSIWGQTRSFQERLPKVARMSSVYLGRRGSRSWTRAEGSGLLDMLGSDSLRRFGERLTGRRLSPGSGGRSCAIAKATTSARITTITRTFPARATATSTFTSVW
jgi:hypothetical protein